MSHILTKILETKKTEIARLEPDRAELKARAAVMEPPRDFLASLQNAPGVPIIAEIKRASPSRGAIRENIQVPEQAAAYESGGAAALSVLTDSHYFKGSFDDLKGARESVSLPVLCKDFIISELQVYRARSAGADAALLIAAALETDRLRGLAASIAALGMTALIEVHNREELDRVLPLNHPLIGINNRNLTTMEVDIETCAQLRKFIPAKTFVVGESGITGSDDIRYLTDKGLDGFLVGTELMESPDPRQAVRNLVTASERMTG